MSLVYEIYLLTQDIERFRIEGYSRVILLYLDDAGAFQEKSDIMLF